MGERRARWGYGYQDKVATDRILNLLRKDLAERTTEFEGIRLADQHAGRVDDFVLVWSAAVEGNSIKWSGDAAPLTWGDLIGSAGLLRELADGYQRLRNRWPGKAVSVRLHTNCPTSVEKHHAQLIPTISVSDFLSKFWSAGPMDQGPNDLTETWRKIADHVGLSGVDLVAFVSSCRFFLGAPEPPGAMQDSLDSATLPPTVRQPAQGHRYVAHQYPRRRLHRPRLLAHSDRCSTHPPMVNSKVP